MKYIKDFIKIKYLTENHWNNIELNEMVYGFKIQKGTKWKKGLSENKIIEFENIMGFEFPEILKDYYTVMNGVDNKQINLFGNSGHEYSYSQIIYSFPDDIPAIKDLIKWIYEANGIDEKEAEHKNISKIFPILYHRFMLIDHEKHPILSMWGDDIILFANNIIDLFNKDLLKMEGEKVNYKIKINGWFD